MAAEPTNKPAQRATSAVVLFDSGQAPTARAGLHRGQTVDHDLGSVARRLGKVGNGAPVMAVR
jgi:hypothetical protein